VNAWCDEALAQELVKAQFPELGVSRVRFLSEGQDFRVFEGGGWAWRFPKRAEVEGWLVREGALVDGIRSALGVPVPEFTCLGQPGHAYPFGFVGYPLLPGVSADKVEGAAGPALAAQVARFLTALHSIPVDFARSKGATDASGDFAPETYLGSVREAFDGPVLPGLPAPCRAACEALLRGGGMPAPAPELRLVHADLEAEHILLDPESGRITGVLDWSDACLADPVRDFAALWAWGGDAFLQALLAGYGVPRDPGFLARLQYLGRCFAMMDYAEAQTEGEGQIAFCLRQLETVFAGCEKNEE
jgi:aminoglycoside phosphotransferase (APT) family kinase protein